MSNVITPQFRDRRMWVCACGCATFNLMADGSAECAACDAPAEDPGSGGWAENFKDAGAWDGDEPVQDVHSGDHSPDFARLRVARIAQDDDVALIVVAKEGGSTTAWGKNDTEERLAWLQEKLDAAMAMFRKQ